MKTSLPPPGLLLLDALLDLHAMALASDGLVFRTHPPEEVLALVLRGSEKKGRWFATAPEETVAKLCEAYRLEPYPSQHQMEKLARAVRAPSKHSVFNFFKSMQLKACELCGR